ncbi:MAG TPA: response regulator [Silvibacterium sp.]|nr:response regulator [Silvibacterium sp.]
MITLPGVSRFTADEFFEGEIIPLLDELETEEIRADRPKVLVVDDQRLIADTLAEILEGAGFEAVAAYDGWAALELAAHFKPDYLLSDVLMPHMNGVQLAIAISRTYPAARILLFSGQAGISKIVEEGQLQGYEFELLAKPIHPLKLIERLKEKN